jgi:hypothetical protein
MLDGPVDNRKNVKKYEGVDEKKTSKKKMMISLWMLNITWDNLLLHEFFK